MPLQTERFHFAGPLMVDIEGLELQAHERERLAHPLVGSMILFSRNYHDKKQLCALTESIHAIKPHLMIAVDQEGGRVQRLREEFTPIPAMHILGDNFEASRSVALQQAQGIGHTIASELQTCGIDFSFAPVLDLDFGNSAVIGDRAFHRDPEIVTQLARALIRGFHQTKMPVVGKHFPGHGFVAADSHTEIPIDEREFIALQNEDLIPFRELSVSLDGIMPAHVIYPKMDKNPAGFSAYWLQTVLRQQLNYHGVIFSDDLTMQGATVAGDIFARALAAKSAGCDVLLVCNHPEEADQLIAGWGNTL